MTGVRECSQQRSNLKDDGYIGLYRAESKMLPLYIHRQETISILIILCIYSELTIMMIRDLTLRFL
ncbi:hypothetical protein [Photorhabdus laumondii]|uniref:hypothetical protein n=1 Tax=Photorhabdus laumondii TaxID=2218628 RepID=UPI0002E7D1DF|nr:hypothetical protein [Photorhabdus laumondii]NDK96180.1 hypothetical protein [Photorhabdus laumondii subsp. laumondii]NDL49942.1 hypothetical protein [Photorhabdus laumondii subsp. laumondii]